MSTQRLYQDGRCVGILTFADAYEYKGFRFEISHGCPHKINKDGEPSKREGQRFWSVYYKWAKLSDDEKKATAL